MIVASVKPVPEEASKVYCLLLRRERRWRWRERKSPAGRSALRGIDYQFHNGVLGQSTHDSPTSRFIYRSSWRRDASKSSKCEFRPVGACGFDRRLQNSCSAVRGNANILLKEVVNGMMKRNVILALAGILIIGSCNGTKLSDVLRPKRAESDYILRSCIASAQLTRRLRTNGVSQIASPEEAILSESQSAALILNNFQNKNLIKRSRSNLKSNSRLKARYLVEKSSNDTPLVTVDVKTLRKDVPKVFKKKERLPELDSRRGAARNIDTEADIIVVQPLKH